MPDFARAFFLIPDIVEANFRRLELLGVLTGSRITIWFDWQAQLDYCDVPRIRNNFQLPMEEAGSFIHPCQTQVSRADLGLHIEGRER